MEEIGKSGDLPDSHRELLSEIRPTEVGPTEERGNDELSQSAFACGSGFTCGLWVRLCLWVRLQPDAMPQALFAHVRLKSNPQRIEFTEQENNESLSALLCRSAFSFGSSFTCGSGFSRTRCRRHSSLTFD